MTRSIDKGSARRREVPALLVADVRAGLANGSMVRGTVARVATGMGMRLIRGDILLAYQVSRVVPPLARGQTAIAWEVTEHAVMDEAGWRAPVVGIRASAEVTSGNEGYPCPPRGTGRSRAPKEH